MSSSNDEIPRALVDKTTQQSVILTDHARRRMQQMDTDPELVLRAVLHPDVRYRGSDNTGATEIRRQHGSPISVVVADEGRVVVTVLENTTEEYQRPDKGQTV